MDISLPRSTEKLGKYKVERDLNNYEIVLSGDIALSLEWLNVFGINEDRLMKINKSKKPTANVLFNKKKGKGCFYTRWGSEAKWATFLDESPSWYLIVQE